MKKTFTTLLLLALVSAGYGQYYYIPYIDAGKNPGNLMQDEEQPSAYMLSNYTGWSEILTSTTTDAWSTTENIPFSFDFNGNSFSSYKVSASGVLTFSTSATATPGSNNTSLPSALIPDNSVMAWGMNLSGSNDAIMKKTFGTSPNRQEWIIWASATESGLVGTNIWTYWGIVLEETTNNIYVVDMRTYASSSGNVSLTVGIQIDGSTAIEVSGSPNISSGTTSTGGSEDLAVDNSYYEFIQGTQPSYDLSVTEETVSEYLVLGDAPFDITGVLSNYGTSTITSLDLNYSVNGGSTVTATATGAVNIPSFSDYNFTHPTAWTPTTTGSYTIEVWASNLNGNTDEKPSNDKMSFQVEVVDTFFVRNSLLEVFTSSTCGPCAPGNAQMENVVIPSISNYTVVKYQQNFPQASSQGFPNGDPYHTAESVNRRSNYYAINSIPRMEIDGQWDQNAQSFTASVFNSFQSVPAFLTFEINKAEFSGDMVNIDYDVTSAINFNGGPYKVQTVIVEKETVENVGTNGETEFHNVMMDMIPNENGSNIGPLTAGNTINITKSSNLSASNVEEMHDLRVVVWVEDISTKTVLNSAWAEVTVAAGIGDIDDSGNGFTNIFPNPANDHSTIQYQVSGNEKVSIHVMNTMGQEILSETTGNQADGVYYYDINTSQFDSGIYMVTVQIGDKSYTKRLLIAK